jgi:hypothetical protein
MVALASSLYDRLGERIKQSYRLQLYSEPLAEELSLLLICINMMCPVLHEVIELLAVLKDSAASMASPAQNLDKRQGGGEVQL